VLLVSLSCGAPESEPATGAVAEDVRQALRDGTATFDHTIFDALLAAAVQGDLIRYDVFSARRSELDRYLEAVAHTDLAVLAPDELMALLLNAYNALTIDSILEHAPVASIRDIDGVWDRVLHEVGGHQVTLDGIEHNLLRPFFRDPRIHFAVNCASLSCAPLPPWAFDGPRLEEQLEERTAAFLRDPRHVRIEDDRLLLSRYFDWYGEDFTAEGWSPRADEITSFIAARGSEQVAQAIEAQPGIEMRFLDYDWSLNAASAP
jgi:hypothetical protein